MLALREKMQASMRHLMAGISDVTSMRAAAIMPVAN
jgi:hypothetical protein